MTDSDKPVWQGMEQKAPDELHGCDGDRHDLVCFSIPVREGDHAVFAGHDALIRYGDAMRIAAQILKDVFGALERFAHTDDPVVGVQGIFELAELHLL